MSIHLDRYDVRAEEDVRQDLDFNNRSRLKHTDQVFKAEITNVVDLTADEKLFHLYLLDKDERERFSFLPGQFVMVEVPGYGEIPISISDSPARARMIELVIRKAGQVTNVLHRAKPGAVIGLRGPFGSHFPMEKMKGQNVLLIAGGLGIAPLRAPIFSVTENRAEYDDVHLLYGTRTPDQMLFRYQYEQWRDIYRLKLHFIVEKPDESWDGEVGMITKLLDGIDTDMKRTWAIVCGPPIMFQFVCDRLAEMGLPMNRMFVSLERRMHCGMGKCCRCNVGSTYTCIDGPVFDYWEVQNLKEAI
jgi:sulfhydrogenase subunit gamma (sulfur reductase)